jgi:hypothetical protein
MVDKADKADKPDNDKRSNCICTAEFAEGGICGKTGGIIGVNLKLHSKKLLVLKTRNNHKVGSVPQ